MWKRGRRFGFCTTAAADPGDLSRAACLAQRGTQSALTSQRLAKPKRALVPLEVQIWTWCFSEKLIASGFCATAGTGLGRPPHYRRPQPQQA